MAFNYYNRYYGKIIATKVRKQLGKSFIYRVVHNQQQRYPYVVPSDPRNPVVLNNRNKIRLAVLAWKSLTEIQKNFYRAKEPITPTMSGYNFFVSEYVKNL